MPGEDRIDRRQEVGCAIDKGTVEVEDKKRAGHPVE
jgi:hypothetical protein